LPLLLEIDQVDSTVLGTDGGKEGGMFKGTALEAGQLRDGHGFEEAEGTA